MSIVSLSLYQSLIFLHSFLHSSVVRRNADGVRRGAGALHDCVAGNRAAIGARRHDHHTAGSCVRQPLPGDEADGAHWRRNRLRRRSETQCERRATATARTTSPGSVREHLLKDNDINDNSVNSINSVETTTENDENVQRRQNHRCRTATAACCCRCLVGDVDVDSQSRRGCTSRNKVRFFFA